MNQLLARIFTQGFYMLTRNHEHAKWRELESD